MTLETKLNLMKLKTRANSASAASYDKDSVGGEAGGIEMTTMGGISDEEEEEKRSMKMEAMFNEDAEDSAESDSEIEVKFGISVTQFTGSFKLKDFPPPTA